MRYLPKISMGTRLVLGLAVMGGLSACDLDKVLEVNDPSRFTDEALDNVKALDAVANGVEGNFQHRVDAAFTDAGLLSDELMHTGTWAGYEDEDLGRHRPPPGPGGPNWGSSIHLRAKSAAERFIRVLGESEAMSSELMARVVAIDGWDLVMQATFQCEAVIEPVNSAGWYDEGEEEWPAVPDMQIWEAAKQVLTNAIGIANAAGSSHYRNLATAGRARARLVTGDFDGALQDAQSIPNGWEYLALYAETSSSNSFVTLNHYTENKAAGLDSRRWSQVDTTDASGDDFFLDHFSGQPDPRVQICHRCVATRLGVDGVKKFYSQNKYTVRGSDIPVTHWREMRLIEAEVYWNKGQFQQAIDKMNEVRAAFGLPDLDNPGTSQGVFDYLLEERFATLFLEGQRAHDLQRFGLFPQVIGTGYHTKWPMSTTEMLNNTQVSQPRSCPVLS